VLGEGLHGEVSASTNSREGEGNTVRLRFRIRRDVLESLVRRVGPHYPYVGLDEGGTNNLEAIGAVGQGLHVGLDRHHRSLLLGDGIPIGLRRRQLRCAQTSARTDNVFHFDLLAQVGLRGLGEGTGDAISPTTLAKGADVGDILGRIRNCGGGLAA